MRHYKSIFLLICVLLFGCSTNDPVVRDLYISVGEGKANFSSEFYSLDSPRGIMPSVLDYGRGNRDIILKVPNDYYEYFAFDDEYVVILLSFDPYFYIKIKSKQLVNHFNTEYLQFYNNVRLSPYAKSPSSSFYEEDFGKYRISIQFTPSEINYSSSPETLHAIQDIFSTNSNDPESLLESSDTVVFYTPLLENPVLYNKLDQQQKEGKKRYIYTNESSFPPIYSEEFNSLNFSFMFFLNDNTTGENRCTIFSMPMGDPTKIGDRDYLRKSHGISISISGDIELFKMFFEKKGFSFVNPPSTINKFYAERIDDSNDILLSWPVPGNVKLEYRRRLKHPTDYPTDWLDLNWQLLADNVATTSYPIHNAIPGYHYYYRLTDNSTGKQLERNIVLPIDPSTVTTYDLTTGDISSGEIAITEINLVGSGETFVNSYGNTQILKRDDCWFEIKNVGERIIRLDNLDFYFHNTESGSITYSEIIFGKNCQSTDSNRKAVTAIMYPGEFFILSKRSNYLFSDILIRNIAIRYFPDTLPVNNRLIIMNNNIILDSLDTDSFRGVVAEHFHSSVYGYYPYNNKYQWIYSNYDFVNMNPYSVYGVVNYCTPGIAETGEFGF